MSTNPIRRRLLGFMLLTPVGSLVACGYRMRGMVDLPFKAVAITGNPSPPLRADLQTAILTGTDVKVAINPKDADLILDISNELNGREILAYSSTGQVSAYRLTVRVTFRAYDLAGGEIFPDNEIYITRDLDFSNTTVLASDVQQAQFLTQMRKDLAVQILRRISAAAKNPRPRSF
jgi:LPS-assembly lipoprotein